VLPEHLHCIWTLPDEDGDYLSCWARIMRLFVESWTATGGKPAAISHERPARHDRGTWMTLGTLYSFQNRDE
jgi:putative transposase